MKCKWCNGEMVSEGRYNNVLTHRCKKCRSTYHNNVVTKNKEYALRLGTESFESLLRMRAEHARQKKRIADLTPPIKAGDFFWGVYDNVMFEYNCDHCYKVDEKWIVVWLDREFVEHKLIWGETAFATEAEALAHGERLNGGNE